MARVRKDKTSWKAGGIWLKDFVVHPEFSHTGKRKKTGKWCKGKEGKVHDWFYEESAWHEMRWKFRRYYCVECGKTKLECIDM